MASEWVSSYNLKQARARTAQLLDYVKKIERSVETFSWSIKDENIRAWAQEAQGEEMVAAIEKNNQSLLAYADELRIFYRDMEAFIDDALIQNIQTNWKHCPTMKGE